MLIPIGPFCLVVFFLLPKDAHAFTFECSALSPETYSRLALGDRLHPGRGRQQASQQCPFSLTSPHFFLDESTPCRVAFKQWRPAPFTESTISRPVRLTHSLPLPKPSFWDKPIWHSQLLGTYHLQSGLISSRPFRYAYDWWDHIATSCLCNYPS